MAGASLAGAPPCLATAAGAAVVGGDSSRGSSRGSGRTEGGICSSGVWSYSGRSSCIADNRRNRSGAADPPFVGSAAANGITLVGSFDNVDAGATADVPRGGESAFSRGARAAEGLSDWLCCVACTLPAAASDPAITAAVVVFPVSPNPAVPLPCSDTGSKPLAAASEAAARAGCSKREPLPTAWSACSYRVRHKLPQ